MHEPFEIQGHWWLPEDPDNKVPGTLAFDPADGVTLELFGGLGGIEGISHSTDRRLVLGISSNGKEVTLEECWGGFSPVGWPRATSSTLVAGTIIVGEHFEKEDDIGFERLIVEYLYLDAWANDTGFEVEIVDDPEKHPITIHHELPDSRTAKAGGYEVDLEFGSNLKMSPRPFTEATLTQSARLVIRFSEKQSLNDLVAISYNLQHFLSFGTNRAVYPTAMWGVSGEAGKVFPAGIHYRPTGSEVGDQARPGPYDMRFMLSDLPGGFDAALGRWLEKSDLLGPVYRLYFGTIYNPNSFVEQQFLSMAQAAEAYHRRAIGSIDLPEDQHKERLNSILDSAPEEHRNWLEGKLAYSNELNLRKRLKVLLRNVPDGMKPEFEKNKKQRMSFVGKAVDARNYRAHFDKSKEDEVVRGIDLFPLTRKLKLLLEICLLREIGFEGEHLEEILKRRG